ncbi:MAG: hypothetical protein M1814_004131 [Vezdaea aestivalis]|nr:MAG: hypothetical protein M1814_004131 [Vezdaea aestivalis]
MSTLAITAASLTHNILNNYGFPASQTWINNFLSTQQPTTPINSLNATARFRLLHSNILNSLAPPVTGLFPIDITTATRPERRIKGPIIVQVVGFEDISRSKWDQVEALEAEARGEGRVGMEIVRVVREEGDEDDHSSRKGPGLWKLLVEDAKGKRVWAVEFVSVNGVGQGMCIGCKIPNGHAQRIYETKILLKNILVARGVLLMEPPSTTVLGGKIEAAHKEWLETRLERLKVAARQESR